MTATEAARGFSEVLNRVAAGEEIEVVRNGAPIGVISPPARNLVGAGHFRALLDSAPPTDEDFAEDVRALRRTLGPPQGSWPS